MMKYRCSESHLVPSISRTSILFALGIMAGILTGCTLDALDSDDPVSSEEIAHTQTPIIGGHNTTISDHPWQVSLRSSSGSHFCGGSIITPEWIVTAAHCAVGRTTSNTDVVAGTSTRTGIGQRVDVAQIIIHPGYNSFTLANDIALMRVSPMFDLSRSGISTIQIASDADAAADLTDPGVYASVSGWGNTQVPSSTPASTLQEVDLPIVPNSTATSFHGRTVSADMIAAGFLGGQATGGCHGDSGGPLVVADGTKTDPLLAGAVSWGNPSCNTTYPTVFARISHFHDWIRNQVGCSANDPGGWSYCSAICPCGAGKGDCDGDAQCMEGLTCVNDVGANYGWSSIVDVCEETCNTGSNGGWAYCTRDCPGDIGEGDCDYDSDCLPGLVCKHDIGASYGFPSAMDICERPCTSGPRGGWTFCSTDCPCGEGEGDCDFDSECADNLKCVDDVGASYGYAAAVDVCLPDNSCTSSTSQVPSMTSPTSPSGIVTRSGVYSSSYEGWKAFDSSITGSSMWISKTWQAPAWLAYEWTNGSRIIDRYAIHFKNGSSLTTRAPRDWTFQGWNGSGWIILDMRTNQTGWSGSQTRTFDVANPGRYSKYRLHVTKDNDSRSNIVVISMAHLSLYGCQ